MTRQTRMFLKKVSLTLTAGIVFGGLSCVTAADLLGTGLSLVSGPAPGLPTLGVGLDLIADLVKYTPLGG
ncbi:MAG: hypothetical protein HZA51_12660 [Planctomycetes bacterium]|nr:hypothetical protein [Planctomycetota bacterium]